MHISELETPALLIDLDRMERNLKRVADYCVQHGLRLRPHTKTHKIPAIGRMQLDQGAVGLTVAKVGEAEVMLTSGTPDLLVAYPIFGASKLQRLCEVARKTNVTVALDSPEALEGLSQAAQASGVAFSVLVEANVGMNRCGLEPGEDLAALARKVEQLPGVRLAGVQFYADVWLNTRDGPDQFRRVARHVERIGDDFERAGLQIDVMSGGSTPTLFHSHEIPGMNEIRPGTYVFNDVNEVTAGACGWEDCAVTIMTTVISTPRAGFALIDGGSKTFTSDRVPFSTERNFGRVSEAPKAVFYDINEEHGFLDVRQVSRPIKLEERLRIIPNHVCVTVNLQETVYGIRGETVERTWLVEGRGKLR